MIQGICIGQNLLLGIGIGLVGIFLHRWNPTLSIVARALISLHG